MVDLHRALEHVLARRHEAQRVSHPPGCELAYPQSLGQADSAACLTRRAAL